MTFRTLLAAGLCMARRCRPACAGPVGGQPRLPAAQGAAGRVLRTLRRRHRVGPAIADLARRPRPCCAAMSRRDDWDLVQVSGGELLAGCDEGLFEKLNWPAIGGRDRYLPQAVSDCGVGAGVASIVLAWDRDKFPATPTWSDFWDVARYPGKRGLRRTARTNLEIALLADGVAPADVYRVLRTRRGGGPGVPQAGADQALPRVVDARGAGAQMLSSGEVLLSSADNVAVTLANRTERRHFGLQWSGSLYERAVLGRDEEQPRRGRRAQAAGLRRRSGAAGGVRHRLPSARWPRVPPTSWRRTCWPSRPPRPPTCRRRCRWTSSSGATTASGCPSGSTPG